MSKSFLSYTAAAVAAYFGYWNLAATFLFNGVSAEKQRRAKNRARDAYNASLQDRMVMLDLLPEAPRTIALGRVRAVEGVRRRWVSGDNNEKLTLIVSFAGHEIDGFETFWFNDIPLTLDGSGYVVKPAQITGCSVVRSGTTATLTKTSHGRQNGEKVLIAGFSLAEFNGTFVVAGATANTFTYTIQNTGGGNPPGAAGTIDVLSPYGVDSIESHTLSGTLDGSGNASVTLTNSTINLPTAVYVSGLGDASSQGTLTVTLVSGLDYTLSGGPAGADYFVTWQHTLTTSMVRIRTYLGTDAQSVGTDMAAEYPGKLATTDDFAGIALAVIDLNYDDSVFPQGIPNITATFRGAKCLDPRTNLTEWTENPAVHAYHYARLATGWNVPSAEIRSQDFEDAADFCDTSTLFTLGVDDVTLARYRCGIVLSTDADPRQNMNAIMESMAGRWGWAGGTLRMRCGRMATAVWAMDASWIARQVGNGGQASDSPVVRITNGVPREEKVNHVAGTCVDPDQRYQALPYPAVRDEVLIAADGAEYRLDADMPGVNHIAHAQHLASIIVREGQVPLRMEVTSNLLAYPLELFDVGTVTVDRYGMTNKTFEVIGWRWRPTEGVSLRLSEITDAIFEVVNTLNGRDPAPNGSLPSPWYVEQVVGVAVAADATIQPDGTVFTLSTVTWTAITNQAVLVGGKVEVQYTRVDAIPAASVDWTSWIEQGGSASAAIPGLPADVYYLFRVRAINSFGVRGPWSDQVMHLVLSDVVAPEDVTNLDWEIKPGLVRITCDPCIARDYAETELRYMDTEPDYDSGDWDAATFLVSGKSNEYHHPRPPNGTYYVLAKHKDTSGNYSVNPAYITVVVDDSIDFGLGGTLRLSTSRFPVFMFATGTTHTALAPGDTDITITARLIGLVGVANFVAEAFDSSDASLGTFALGGTGNARTISAAQFVSLGTSGSVRTVVVAATLGSASDYLTIYRQDSTTTAPRLYLSNPFEAVATDEAGDFGDYSNAVTDAVVYAGVTDVTADYVWSITPDSGVTATINDGAGPVAAPTAVTVAVSDMTISDGVVLVEADDGVNPPLTATFFIYKNEATSSGYAFYFTPRTQIVLPVNSAGDVASYTDAWSDLKVVKSGSFDDTANWALTKRDVGVTSTLTANRVQITGFNELGSLDTLVSSSITPATGWTRGNSVTYAAGTWVMFGYDPTGTWSVCKTSTDYETWADASMGAAGRWSRGSYGLGKVYAIETEATSNNKVLVSADKGATWSSETLSLSSVWAHVLFGDVCIITSASSTSASKSAGAGSWSTITMPAAGCSLAYSDTWAAVSPAGDLYGSLDSGATWSASQNAAAGVPAGNVFWRAVGFLGQIVGVLRDSTTQVKVYGATGWSTAITPQAYSRPRELLVVSGVLYLLDEACNLQYTTDGYRWASASATYSSVSGLFDGVYGIADSVPLNYLPMLGSGAGDAVPFDGMALLVQGGTNTSATINDVSTYGGSGTATGYCVFDNTHQVNSENTLRVTSVQPGGVEFSGAQFRKSLGGVFTVDCYIWLTTVANYAPSVPVWRWGDSSSAKVISCYFYGDTGALQIEFGTDGGSTVSTLSAGVQHFTRFTISGRAWLFAVDGVQVASGTMPAYSIDHGTPFFAVAKHAGAVAATGTNYVWVTPLRVVSGFELPITDVPTGAWDSSGGTQYALKQPLGATSADEGAVVVTATKPGEASATIALPVRKGSAPTDIYTSYASPGYLLLPATADGVITGNLPKDVTAFVNKNGVDDTSAWTWSYTTTHLTPASGSGNVATITAMDSAQDLGTINFTASKPGLPVITGTIGVEKMKGSESSGPRIGAAYNVIETTQTWIGLKFLSDGRFQIKRGSGGSYANAGNWAMPLSSSNGATYWLQIIASSPTGDSLTTGTTGAWLALTSEREYVLSNAASGTHTINLQVLFATSSGGANAAMAFGTLQLIVP